MSLVDAPREPLRPVVADDASLDACLAALAAADGPVGFDVERAHGYRYWPRAYLFQIRRGRAGTWLIDPTAFDLRRLGGLVAATEDAEWIIHAASQDLPSMAEAGVLPARIFDTELAARLLGKPGFSLGALLSAELDVQLRKAHSAVNWATRPLKQSWLDYAALDVDFLAELRDVLARQLDERRRRHWAEQEFAWELDHYGRPPEPRPDPWRRTSRITDIRHPRGLALARELWQERDAIARRRDRPPTHILPDQAIVEIAIAIGKDRPADRRALTAVPGFRSNPGSRYLSNWLRAVERFNALTPDQYPPKRLHDPNAIPHPRQWERSNPSAARRWALVRPAVDELACELGIQVSLVAPPAPLQQVVWRQSHPDEAQLLEAGMRPWQADLLSGLFDELLD